MNDSKKVIAISAPTSAGKSFIITLKLLEIIQRYKYDIIYVVPTISLVNQVSPIHIKQNSIIHNVANTFVKMKGEVEDCVATGEVLMNGSVKLKQGFGATGYADGIRFYKDFSSRMYFMEEIC